MGTSCVLQVFSHNFDLAGTEAKRSSKLLQFVSFRQILWKSLKQLRRYFTQNHNCQCCRTSKIESRDEQKSWETLESLQHFASIHWVYISQEISINTEVITIYPWGTVDKGAKFYSNPSNSFWEFLSGWKWWTNWLTFTRSMANYWVTCAPCFIPSESCRLRWWWGSRSSHESPGQLWYGAWRDLTTAAHQDVVLSERLSQTPYS